MNEKTILDILSLQNRWWYDKTNFPFKKTHKIKRSDYYYLKNVALPKEEVLVVLGPRGVGKSTVLMELIKTQLGFNDKEYFEDITKYKTPTTGIDGKSILYISFDDVNLQKQKLLDLIKIYAKLVLKKDINKLGEKAFIFFDEIQNVEDWGEQIKLIQDLGLPLKFVISGSSSVAMLDEASKATRRVDVYRMVPLKFSDYLCFHIPEKKFFDFKDEFKFKREKLVDLFSKNDVQGIYDLFLQAYNDFKPYETEIQVGFHEYIIKGGYPGFFKIKDYSECTSKLSQTFWLGFHKDLVLAKGIGDPIGMKELTQYIASISSCETNYTSLMNKSQATTNTGMMKKYLYHLENAFLVNQSHLYKTTVSKKGSSFKIYMNDLAIRNMLTSMLNEFLLDNDIQYGFAIETLIFDHLLRFNFKFKESPTLFYWKDKKTNREVDVVLDFPKKPIPVEVKKGDFPNDSEVAGLKSFCEKYKVPGIVTCGQKLELIGNILFVPHWLFVMIC